MLPWLALLLANNRGLRKAGVVERQPERPGDLDGEGIVNHRQPLGLRMRIHVQNGVEIAAIRPADVDDVGLKNPPVRLIEIHPLLHHGFGLIGVVELETSIGRLYPGTKKLDQDLLVHVQVFVPQTRTPDAHFFTEVRYKGTKAAVVSPDYAEATKFADLWLHPKQGTDSALAMAMGHVILREYHLQRTVPYFHDYIRKYSDLPLLVRLVRKDGRYSRPHGAGRGLRGRVGRGE